MSRSTPKVIRRSDPAVVEIEWQDGAKTLYTAKQLRGMCPCAQCVSETTGRRLIDPAALPDDLRQNDLAMVGNYAVTMRFSDGHHTGIYTFELLRENDPRGDGSGG